MPAASRTAYESAVMLLARRLSSRRELTRKLAAKRKWSVSEIEDALNQLERQGFLNDRAFAEDVVLSLRSRGYGLSRIRQTLRMKGVPQDVAESALERESCDGAGDELENALALLPRRKAQFLREADPAKRKAKIARFLVGRGYDCETAFAAADRFSRSLAEENESC